MTVDTDASHTTPRRLTLILAPLRHVQSLAELTVEGAATVGPLLRNASIALTTVTGCEKTYVMLFAEADGFAHLHIHLVPRMADQPEDRRGPAMFGHLTDPHTLCADERDEIARALLAAWPAD